MIRARTAAAAFASLGFLLPAACVKQGSDVFQSNAFQLQKKPAVRTEPQSVAVSAQGGQSLVDTSGAQTVFQAAQSIRIVTRSGTEVCKGKLEIQVKAGGLNGLGFTIPDGLVNCLGVKVHLARLLSQLSPQLITDATTSTTGNAAASAVSAAATANGLRLDANATPAAPGSATLLRHEKGVLRGKSFLGVEFDSYRPLMIGPLLQDLAPLEAFRAATAAGGSGESRNYMVKFLDAQNVERNAQGTITLKVHQLKGAQPEAQAIEGLSEPLKEILHFSIETTGFENMGLARAKALLFDKFEMQINARPWLFPMVAIESTVNDFVSSDLVQGDTAKLIEVAGGLVGVIRIEILTTKWKAL